MKSTIRTLSALALVAAMAWVGSTLMSSPSVAAIDSAVDAPVAMTGSTGESASAVTTLVAESTVGATIFSRPRGPLVSGLSGMRRRAGYVGRSTGVEVLALSSHAGGWWFRHSCFVP